MCCQHFAHPNLLLAICLRQLAPGSLLLAVCFRQLISAYLLHCPANLGQLDHIITGWTPPSWPARLCRARRSCWMARPTFSASMAAPLDRPYRVRGSVATLLTPEMHSRHWFSTFHRREQKRICCQPPDGGESDWPKRSRICQLPADGGDCRPANFSDGSRRTDARDHTDGMETPLPPLPPPPWRKSSTHGWRTASPSTPRNAGSMAKAIAPDRIQDFVCFGYSINQIKEWLTWP